MDVYWKHPSELRLTAADCQAVAQTARIVESTEESQRLNGKHGPMIIIAASGIYVIHRERLRRAEDAPG